MKVAGGIEQMSIQSKMTLYGEIGKDLCTHLIQPFLDERDLTTEARSLFCVPPAFGRGVKYRWKIDCALRLQEVASMIHQRKNAGSLRQ